MASIVTLKTGQNVICEVREIYQGEGDDRKGVGLQLSDPFILDLYENPEAEDPEDRNKVRFSRWNPFTLERTFRVPYDAVVAVSSPDPNLEGAFASKVEFFDQYESEQIVEDIISDEPTDTPAETEE
jgi:hypothetical protein